jgi:LPXTG-site transpeptidase (sortase) family protein
MSHNMALKTFQRDDMKAPISVFLAAAVVIFFLALSAADSVGFVPCAIDGTCTVENSLTSSNSLSELPAFTTTQSAATSTRAQAQPQGVLPTRIKINAVSINLPIQNPDTHDTATLDGLLQSGPARFVDSAQLGQSGNMVIFAHSSHLPIVHNQMFKAFNNLPNLKPGDTITLQGADGKNYLYTVTGVRKADASEDEKIYLSSDTAKLTLVTCDTLTGKSARFIAEADFVGVE